MQLHSDLYELIILNASLKNEAASPFYSLLPPSTCVFRHRAVVLMTLLVAGQRWRRWLPGPRTRGDGLMKSSEACSAVDDGRA